MVWSRCKQHWVCHPKDTVGRVVGFAGRRALHSISSELVQHCKRAWAVLCGTCHFGPVSNSLVCTMACVLPLQGQVYAMAFANNTLFSAGQDTTIRVWALNEQAGIFVSQVRTAVQGLAGWVLLQGVGTAAGGIDGRHALLPVDGKHRHTTLPASWFSGKQGVIQDYHRPMARVHVRQAAVASAFVVAYRVGPSFSTSSQCLWQLSCVQV